MKLIPYWKSAWRFVSVWLGALATFVTTAIVAFPDAALHAWLMLPQEIKSTIPPQYMPLIGVALMGGAVLARLVQQPKTAAVIEQKLAEKQVKQDGIDGP